MDPEQEEPPEPTSQQNEIASKRVTIAQEPAAKKAKPKTVSKKSKKKKTKRRGEVVRKSRVSLRDMEDEIGRGCFRTAGDLRYKGYYKIYDIKTPCYIKYLARCSMLWEIFIYVTIVLNFAFTLFGIIFTYHNTFVWWTVLVLDLLFATDVIMRLSVELWRYKTQSEVIIFPIPYRFLYCIFDLLSLLPIHSIYQISMDKNNFNHIASMDYLRLNTLLRCIPRFIFFYNLMKESRIMSDQLLFIIRFFNLYLAFINMVSCVLFAILNLNPVDQLLWKKLASLKDTWARNIDSIKPGYGHEPIDLYILTTHFSTATTTTVGYGDLYAVSESEMIFCIFVMLVGAIFLNGYFTSEITSFQLEVDGARFDLYHRLAAIRHFLKQAGMSKFFAAKIEHYYKCLWTYKEGVEKVTFIDFLPRSLQEDMYYDVCLEMFHKSSLFQNLDEAFLRAVSKVAKISLYNPDMVLCRYGGYANQMYYLIQGECQAMSKHDLSKRAAVLRAGSLIGEVNLFFSCPYTISVETITCCQFISIDKEELMLIFNKFNELLDLMRARSEIKLKEMYDYYQAFGIDPICWVEKKFTDEDANELEDDPVPKAVGRWGDGYNELVMEDVIVDIDRFVIFETPCTDPKYEKNHVTPYLTCVVPEILTTKVWWIAYWNYVIIVFALVYSFIGPYCLAFGSTSNLESFVCNANTNFFEIATAVVYFLDVFLEILGACPVQGLYFKLWDGLKIRQRQFMFYVDIVSAMPLEIMTDDKFTQLFDAIIKSLKFWKVIRFLRYLENIYPRKLFWFRIIQTLLVLLYGIHFIACLMFFFACVDLDGSDKEHSCTSVRHHNIDIPKITWLGSHKNSKDLNHEVADQDETPEEISKTKPYAISFYFSAATLTSAGFGDFSPQNKKEILFTILFQLVGFFIIGYYTALLTSALACVVKPKLEFTQKLVSVRRFMDYYAMPEPLQRRVVEHYELQHQFHHGVNLRADVKHYLYDAPDYLKNDALYTDMVVLLDGVPLFSKTESKFIIKLAECLERYLIPPNVEFLLAGEVRRTLYILRSGSMGVYAGSCDSCDENEEPLFYLEESAHFGLRDLLFQEPSQYNYKTLSFCLLYEVKYKDFQDIFEEDEELMNHVEECKEKIRVETLHTKTTRSSASKKSKLSDASVMGETAIPAKQSKTSSASVISDSAAPAKQIKSNQPDRSIDTPSWIWYKPKSKDRLKAMRYDEYVQYFDRFGGGRLWKMYLMNGIVHPVGLFAKVWSCFMSLISMMSICFLMMETYMHCRSTFFRIAQVISDLFFYVDVYIKMHMGYYLKDGLLVAHPLKTAANYVFNGNFFIDLIFCAHAELVLTIWGFVDIRGSGPASTWFTKIRWSKLGEIFQIPKIFRIIHGVFKWRTISLFALYIGVTLIVCTAVGAIAVYVACPWEESDWAEGDEMRLPLCLKGSWADTDNIGDSIDKRAKVLSDLTSRWIIAIYYVCQVILVIGFGDMITLNIKEIYLLIFMSVFGFVFLRCIIADITAAEVDSDEIRARYIIRMKRILTAMKRENCDRKLINAVQEHLAHTWKQSRGLQPRDLFHDLHAALESDLYHCFVGDKLKKVPVFKEFEANALQSLRKHVKKLHFLPGDRISRAGNLEYEMHIIVKGKVWVAHESLIYGCCLHKNETFGEASLISHSARQYNFIAGTNVETFVITQEDFSLIFERYPKVRKLLVKYTGNGTCDYFQSKIYDELHRIHKLPHEEKNEAININWKKTSQLRHIISTKEPEPDGEQEEEDDKQSDFRTNVKTKLLKHLIGFGIDDDNLPFLYFVPQKKKSRDGTSEKVVYFPPLLHPNCILARLFLGFMNGLFYMFPAITLYELCFPLSPHGSNPSGSSVGFGRFIENVSNNIGYVIVFYMLLKFFLPYQDDDGAWVKNSKTVATNYLTSITGFLLDFIVICPSLVFTFLSYFEPYHTKLFHWTSDISRPKWRDFRLTSLLFLYRFYKHQWSKSEDLRISAFEQKIIVSVSSFSFMSHFLACFFYRISACQPPPDYENSPEWVGIESFCKDETWPQSFLEDKGWQGRPERYTPYKWYVRSFYWVTAVVSTTGFGDITPQNVQEMIFGILCVFCGGFILSVILSQFTSGMASLTKGYREYLYNVKLLVRYLRNVGLSSLRQNQIHLYFQLTWTNCRGKLYHSSIEILPTALRIEVANALFETILKEVLFFSPQQVSHKAFIRQVAVRVKHSVYLPGVCIVKEGDPGDLLYIVYRGRVSGVWESDNGVILKSVYLVGDVFGKVPALFYDALYRKNYRAEEYTEVLALAQSEILHLASIYEDFWKLLTAYVELHYNPDGEYDCIFSESRAVKAKDIYDLGADYSAPDNKVKNKEKDKDKKKKKNKKDVLAHAQGAATALKKAVTLLKTNNHLKVIAGQDKRNSDQDPTTEMDKPHPEQPNPVKRLSSEPPSPDAEDDTRKRKSSTLQKNTSEPREPVVVPADGPADVLADSGVGLNRQSLLGASSEPAKSEEPPAKKVRLSADRKMQPITEANAIGKKSWEKSKKVTNVKKKSITTAPPKQSLSPPTKQPVKKFQHLLKDKVETKKRRVDDQTTLKKRTEPHKSFTVREQSFSIRKSLSRHKSMFDEPKAPKKKGKKKMKGVATPITLGEIEVEAVEDPILELYNRLMEFDDDAEEPEPIPIVLPPPPKKKVKKKKKIQIIPLDINSRPPWNANPRANFNF